MHNIAEGFDSETNAEFIRFYDMPNGLARKSRCELYVAVDEQYIFSDEFNDVYEQGTNTAAVRGFINYLKNYEKHKVAESGS